MRAAKRLIACGGEGGFSPVGEPSDSDSEVGAGTQRGLETETATETDADGGREYDTDNIPHKDTEYER